MNSVLHVEFEQPETSRHTHAPSWSLDKGLDMESLVSALGLMDALDADKAQKGRHSEKSTGDRTL